MLPQLDIYLHRYTVLRWLALANCDVVVFTHVTYIVMCVSIHIMYMCRIYIQRGKYQV